VTLGGGGAGIQATRTSEKGEKQIFDMSVTLHTTLGDMKVEVFCEDCPKTAEVRDMDKEYFAIPLLRLRRL